MRGVLSIASVLARVSQLVFQRALRRSDYKRWTDLENLYAWWDTRTEKLARLVPPGSRVLELGAGRRQLERFLDPSCVYFPSDLAAHDSDTIVFDLNVRPLPNLRHIQADVAVLGGVLEYIRDVPSLAQWLSGQARVTVASYDYVKSRPLTWERLVELLRRSYSGYLNSYTTRELAAIFARAGLQWVKTDTWNSQQLFVFASSSHSLGQMDGETQARAEVEAQCVES